MKNIALIGHGVVGSGVVEVLLKNGENIKNRAGDEINIKYILDIIKFPSSPLADRFIDDFSIIENDPSISVVIEVVGGVTFAYDYVKRSLLAGKNVVTSNKELVAAKGAELLKIALKNNVNFLFEASVGGGIPIIRPIYQCLAANQINEIAGILNGTTNFILTKMIYDSMNFEDALLLAQHEGYAERNPSADIEGIDSCRKICILASLAYGKQVYPNNVHTEGITKISLEDIRFAAANHSVIKLISRARKLPDGRLFAMVSPAMIKNESQLASVNLVYNAIMVKGDATGDVVFYGKGAGKLPTASAVIADAIDCIKHISARKWLFWEDGSVDYVADYLDFESIMYIRIKTQDKIKARESVLKQFSGAKEIILEDSNDIAFLLPSMIERDFESKITALCDNNISVVSKIRVLDL
jgi:homoserine dehydrogenase